jgi:hypothetical protein
VLRRIFGPKGVEVTGKWKELHNEELHNLYSSPNIIRMVNSRRVRWAKHNTHWEVKSAFKILAENSYKEENMDGEGVRARIILKWILKH